MREIIEKRAARSKTWDNEDGTFTLQVGGAIAHHQKNGQWLETDIVWRDLTSKWGTGEYPFVIDFDKTTRTLTIDYQNGTVLSLTPTNTQKSVSITKDGSTLSFAGLWRGVTLKTILTANGIAIHFIKTASQYTNPTFSVTGPYESLYGPATYTTSSFDVVTVPQTLTIGVLTFDLSAVPVGVEVM